MSTVVVVKKNGKIVIGADTMAKFGTVKQSIKYVKDGSKIIKVGDNYIGYVGDGTFGNVLRNYFSELEEVPFLNSTDSIFQVSLELHKALKEEYFLNPFEEEDDPFESSQFACLIVNPSGIYGLYALRTVDEFSQYFSFGTGLKFALGAMHSMYNTDATAEEIARAGLEAAAEFDDCSGLPIEMYIINEKLT
jgi:ATP-dependent HslUV protease, peptidase subunit HslV